MGKTLKQFGTWPSPVSTRALGASLSFNDVRWSADGDTLVWLEGRGKQGVLVAQQGTQASRDLNDLSVRGGLGYGGGEFTVGEDVVYFAGPNGRLYRQRLDSGAPKALTPAFGDAAAPALSPDGGWLAYGSSYEGVDGLGLIDSAGERWPRKIAFGTDFVMQPTWHPSGSRLAYVTWNFPQMPWDGSELRLATLDYGGNVGPYVVSMATIAGDTKTAIFQPEFSPDGRTLSYVSDSGGWGQIYLYDLTEKKHIQLTEGKGDFIAPAWVQGMRTYGWTPDSSAIYGLRAERGLFSLWRIDVHTRQMTKIDGLSEYTALRQLSVSSRGELAMIGSSSVLSERILTLNPDADATIHIRKRAGSENLRPSQLSQPRLVEWQGHDGETVYGAFYPPASETFEGIGQPPLIVTVHGGPTSQARMVFNGTAQFFATRGFAVLDVYYRGTTGFGRVYQDKLLGGWGLYDVEDCASGAAYLAAQDLVDPQRRVILGGSAGGYTVLQSLVAKPGFYTAGVSLYGISNQFSLAADTHKFEARYNDQLLGPLPQAAAIYRDRSPIFHADRIVDPVILFQGADDKVVPKAQADTIVAALKARGVPHEYHVYEGEGHGWRKPETIEHYYKAVMDFLNQYVVYA